VGPVNPDHAVLIATQSASHRPGLRRRRSRALLGLLLLALLTLLGWWVYRVFIDDWRLQAAIAESDRLDPGWRFQELEAAREPVPDAENGALQVLAAAALLFKAALPPPPAQGPGLEQVVAELPPEVRLNADLLRQVRAHLDPAGAALASARRLADMPRGRYHIAYSNDLVGTPVPHLEDLGKLARLLSLESALRAEQGDASGALVSAQATLNVGRSVGDESFAVSQMVRLACVRRALGATERALAQGEPVDGALVALQHLLEDEAGQPLFLRAMRGERAMLHHVLEIVRAKQFNRRAYGFANPRGVPDFALNLLDAYRSRLCHHVYLHYLNELVEIAKLPADQRAARVEQLEEPTAHKPSILLAFNAPDRTRMVQIFQRNEALVRCALVALAVERFRRDQRRWPTDLESLVAGYLRAVPADPFDGAPLRYRRLPDGVVIYAVGTDGKDDGGRLERGGTAWTVAPGHDVGFRLWDVAHRRQPAQMPTPGGREPRPSPK
jgi:hypothetical protein